MDILTGYLSIACLTSASLTYPYFTLGRFDKKALGLVLLGGALWPITIWVFTQIARSNYQKEES